MFDGDNLLMKTRTTIKNPLYAFNVRNSDTVRGQQNVLFGSGCMKKLGGILLFQHIPLFSNGGDFLWYDFY